MLSTLDIKLLGGFCLSCADKPVVCVTTERPQALLAYLVLHRDIPQTRQRLAFQFWADSTEAQAGTNLRRELHHLRQGLPNADRATCWRMPKPCNGIPMHLSCWMWLSLNGHSLHQKQRNEPQMLTVPQQPGSKRSRFTAVICCRVVRLTSSRPLKPR